MSTSPTSSMADPASPSSLSSMSDGSPFPSPSVSTPLSTSPASISALSNTPPQIQKKKASPRKSSTSSNSTPPVRQPSSNITPPLRQNGVASSSSSVESPGSRPSSAGSVGSVSSVGSATSATSATSNTSVASTNSVASTSSTASSSTAAPVSAGEYLEQHNVYGLFENLMQQLIIHKPTDPISFLIKTLQNPNPLKIIILGAPASGKGTQCEFITKKYMLTHISTGDILRDEVRYRSDIGLKVKKYLDAGALVPDELITDLVLKKLNSPEVARTGWLLDGYPRTKAQALALQEAKIFPDKVILLDVPDHILIERVEGRRIDPVTGIIYHTKFSPPPADIVSRLEHRSDDTADKAKARLMFYHSNLRGVRDCYGAILKNINANQNKDKVFEEIVNYVDKNPGKGPKKPLRICFIGTPASGKRTQAELLAAKYGFVHINLKKLLRGGQGGKGSLPSGQKKIAPHIQSLLVKPEARDKAIGTLLSLRLQQPDCQTRGWIIDGYPANLAQAKDFEKSGIKPSRVVFMELPEAEARRRIANRRIDPATGMFYDINDPPTNEEVAQRLRRYADDEEEAVEVLMQEYRENAEELKNFYKRVTKKINASFPLHTIQELVEDFVRM